MFFSFSFFYQVELTVTTDAYHMLARRYTYTHANFTYADNDKDNTCLSTIRHKGELQL